MEYRTHIYIYTHSNIYIYYTYIYICIVYIYTHYNEQSDFLGFVSESPAYGRKDHLDPFHSPGLPHGPSV